MKPDENQTVIIAVMTAIVSAIMVLRNINGIIEQIKRILSEYAEYWRLRNEKQRNEIAEQRLRVAFWIKAIHTGNAPERLEKLKEGISKDGSSNA